MAEASSSSATNQQETKEKETKEESILDELAHSETVRKLIECPVCLELPLPPIYLCNKGHIVCNSCQARTYACPLCREHYSLVRSFVAEGLIEKCILPCKYVENGCPLTMRGATLADHLEVCDYRPVKCIDCTGKIIEYNDYEDHLLTFHKINGIQQSRAYVIYSMNLSHQIGFGEKCCWPQYYLKAFDNVTFLLRLYATHWFVCAWISLLGPKGYCSKYEAMLEFHPTNDDSVVHTWQGPVNHFRDDPAKDIFLQGRGLITPMETLMQIAPVANEHAEWLYNIEILQVPVTENPAATEPEPIDLENSQYLVQAAEENLDDNAPKATAPTAAASAQETDDGAGGDAATNATTTTPAPAAVDAIIPILSLSARLPQLRNSTLSVESPQRRIVPSRATNESVRALSETPRRSGATHTSRTPRLRINSSGQTQTTSHTPRSSSTTTTAPPNIIVSSRPAPISPSTSVYSAAAVASVLPTQQQRSPIRINHSMFRSSISSAPASTPQVGNWSQATLSENSSSTQIGRTSSRILSSLGLRRGAPFSYAFRGDSPTSRVYGFQDDEWLDFNSGSGSDEE